MGEVDCDVMNCVVQKKNSVLSDWLVTKVNSDIPQDLLYTFVLYAKLIFIDQEADYDDLINLVEHLLLRRANCKLHCTHILLLMNLPRHLNHFLMAISVQLTPCRKNPCINSLNVEMSM